MKTLKLVAPVLFALLLFKGYSQAQSANKFCDSSKTACKNYCVDCDKSNSLMYDLLIYDYECKSLKLRKKGSTKSDEGERISNLKKLRLKYNQEFKFRINGINRYLYDINFQANDIRLNNEPLPLFKNLFLGEGSIDKLIAGLGFKSSVTPEKVDTNSPKAPPAVETFINSFKEFKGKYVSLLDDKVTVYRYCLPNPECACKDDKFSEMSSSLLQVKLDFAKAKKELTKQQKSDFETCTKENKEKEGKIAELKKSIESQGKKKEELEKRVKKLAIASDEAKKLRKEIKSVVALIDELENELNDNALEDCRDEVIEDMINQIDQLGAYLDSIKEESLMSLILFHNSRVADHLEFTSSPIFPQGNRLRLGIGFNPTTNAKQLNFMPLPSDSIGLDIPVIWKPFLTFSSGLFYSYIPQDSYGTKQMPFKGIVSDTSRFSIVKMGSRDATAGFSAFTNLGMKFTGNFGAGVSLGVGVTIEDTPKPAYLAGLSTYWGDRKQLIFTFGLSAIPTKSLKTELYPELGTLLYKTAPSLQYTDTMKTGWFFSITYALFNPEVSKNSKSK
jgi:hypothetical protein